MKYTAKYQNAKGESITFSMANRLIITDFPLLTGMRVKVGTSQSINQVGGAVQNQIVDPRSSTIKGFIAGPSVEMKRRLLEVIRPLEKGKITVNGQYSIEVYVTETPALERENQFARWQFGVIAPFPFWQRETETVYPLSGIVGKFKFPWNITADYQFGEIITKYFTNAYNAGQVPSYYDLQIYAMGEAKNPVISEVNTGKFLRMNKTLAVGEGVFIAIRPDSLTAVSDIDGDIEGCIDIESSLFSLDPGDNVVKYDAEEGRGNLTVSLRFSDKFAGVVV